MRKIFGLLILFAFINTSNKAQVITIKEAKKNSMGTEVTVTGIVTCDVIGNSSVRNFQDATAGLTVYSSDFANGVSMGDSITITGTLDTYQGVIQLTDISSFTVHSSGNALPDPIIITPSQQHDSLFSMLVQVKGVVFEEGAGEPFVSSTYNYTAGGETGVIYVHYNSPLMGEQVPTFPSNMTGIASSYFDNPQILIRNMDDFEIISSIWLISPMEVDSITQDGFTLSWETNISGSTQLLYGNTQSLELPPLEEPGNSTDHSIRVSGRTASEFVYAKAFSVSGEDTAWSVLNLYITRSNSSGDMKVYFNRTVDHSVSSGSDAIQLFHAIDDTLVQYIHRAKHSIDFTIYNYNTSDIADITGALSAAHARGVEVRIVNDYIDRAGWGTLNPDIGRITSPEEDFPVVGIMHNKFVVFDALSPDPDDALVWTGSTNFTTGQINSDPNNVIIIQDQSLAKAYRLEFEEMFGSTGLQPDTVNAKFGASKKDNTPHEFVIGGKRVECYFSPSDGVNQVIERTIMTADHELHVNTMLITRDFLAEAIVDRNNAGVDAKVIVNSEEQCTPNQNPVVVDILKNLDADFRENGEGAILHHKTMIVDQGYIDADPLVLTGCHNWSASADNRNDENTLIVHDATIANIYYQEFYERFKHGKIIADVPITKTDYASMKQGDTLRYNVLDNDTIIGSVNVSITWGPISGEADVENSGLVTYIPDPAFTGLDTMIYKVCAASNDEFCDSSKLIVLVEEASLIRDPEVSKLLLYPNPNSGEFILYNASAENELNLIEVYSMSGKRVHSTRRKLQHGPNQISLPESLERGVYIIRISRDDHVTQLKLMLH